MNFYFTPTRLERARKRVEEKHPFSVKALHDPDALDNAVLERLIERLLATRTDQLGAFVRGLSPLHQQLFSALLVHERDEVRERCLRCLKIEPSLAKKLYLWRAFCDGYFGDVAVEIAELVSREVTLSRNFSEFELSLLRKRVESTAASNLAFWQWALNHHTLPDLLRDEYKIPERSPLTLQLSFYLLMQGTREMWRIESPDRIEATFGRFPQRAKLECLTHAHEIFRALDEKRAAELPQLAVLAAKLRASDALSDALERHDMAASRWWQSLVIRTELTNFFAKLSDNERFQFWEEYIPQMNRAWGDIENLRLFIDFGGFGVIEFGDIGNASYVYRSDRFTDYRKKGLNQDVSHSDLKDRNRAIDRITHGRGWQGKARRNLRQWFARYNNTANTSAR